MSSFAYKLVPNGDKIRSTYPKHRIILFSIISFMCIYYLISINQIHNDYENVNSTVDLKSISKIVQLEQNVVETKPIERIVTNQLRNVIKCDDVQATGSYYYHGKYFIMKNFIRGHEKINHCTDTVTYTTHGDYSFLINIEPLIERWNAPISMALYAPGDDIYDAIQSIHYLLNCSKNKLLIRKYVTFHFFFESRHAFRKSLIPKIEGLFKIKTVCNVKPPYIENHPKMSYRTKNKLLYPINVARNLARNASQTHFVLASDVELYPSLNLANDFIKMISEDLSLLTDAKNRVYTMPIFEVLRSVIVPGNKTELQSMLKKKMAFPFHYHICKDCHLSPKQKLWEATPEAEKLEIFTTHSRTGEFKTWEPIYIGTKYDPFYDERLSWEGKKDKMTQGYMLCIHSFEFNILNNAFLVHSPGIKTIAEARRPFLEDQTNNLIEEHIKPEIDKIYGDQARRNHCFL